MVYLGFDPSDGTLEPGCCNSRRDQEPPQLLLRILRWLHPIFQSLLLVHLADLVFLLAHLLPIQARHL